MVDERIVVRATLRDRLSRPLKDIERQARRTSEALRSMCGVEGCLEHTGKATTDLQRRIRALGQEVDKVKRKSAGLETTQERVAGAVDRATGSTERLTDSQRRLKRRLDQSVRATGQHRNALGRFAKAGNDASRAIEAVGGSAIRHRDHLGRFARTTDSLTGSSIRARDALGRFTRATDDSGMAADRTSDDIDRLIAKVGDLHDKVNSTPAGTIAMPVVGAQPRTPDGRFAPSGGGGGGGGGGRGMDISVRFPRLSRAFVGGARTAEAAAGGIGKLTGSLGKLKDALPGGGGGIGMRMLKMVTMLALIPALVGPAASALGSLAAGGIAAVQALAPLSGVVAALPAGILAMVSSMAAFKIAFKGIGEAVSVLNDPLATADQVNAALADLTPEARAFARQLHTMKPAMDDMRSAVQRGLLPGMSDALSGVASLLPVVTRGMEALGYALGDAGRQAGALFRSDAFSADLGTIMDGNARLVGKMSSALVHLLSALRHVMVAAGPFVDYVGDLVLAFGRWAEATAQVNRANGDTERFLGKTQQRMGQFGRIVRDFAVAWGNIFRLATPMADEGTASLERMAAGFRRWTESAEGVSKISGWFAAMRPVLAEIGGLLKDATFGLLSLSQTSAPGTVGLLQTIRDMGPALMTLFEAAHQSGILESVVSIFGSFAQVLSLVYGPLGPILSLFATLAGWIARLAADTGPAGSAFRGLITIMLWGAVAVKALGLALTIISGIMSAWRIVILAVRGAMLLFNLALLANPIGLVVAAVALLIGGLYLLYQRSETAREVMNAMGRALRWAFDNLTPLGLVIQHFDKIKDAVRAVVDWIGRIDWPDPPKWVQGLFGVGDTATSRGSGGGIGNTAAAHSAIDRSTPGNRTVTNAFVGGGGKGRGSGDHQAGRALDLVGSGLNTYASRVRDGGGYAAFHGSGKSRHLHAVYGRAMGDTTRPRGNLDRQYRTTPHTTRPLPIGDTLAPRAREAVAQKVAGGVTVAEGAIVVMNPSSDIDLRRAIADGLADYERERRERS